MSIGERTVALESQVYIFKAAKESDSSNIDKYEEVLDSNNIPFTVIPVLNFKFVNKDVVISALSQPHQLSGIILTSVRAVDAIVSALKGLNDPAIVEAVTSLQCFVVGPATSTAAAAAGFQPEGEDSGKGDSLVDYIVKNIKEKDTAKSLLFPSSNIRRENIPQLLKNEGFSLNEITVYETHPDENIAEHIEAAIKEKGYPAYTVFFSPSGFHSVETAVSKLLFSLKETKILAIGPVTAAAIIDKDYEVVGVAEKPDPENLIGLLRQKE